MDFLEVDGITSSRYNEIGTHSHYARPLFQLIENACDDWECDCLAGISAGMNLRWQNRNFYVDSPVEYDPTIVF